MKTRYTVYRVGAEPVDAEVNWPAEPSYQEIKALIRALLDGAHMEHVSVLYEGKRADMFVDDEGMNKRLPRNEVPTRIYRGNWLAQHPGTEPESMSAIHGTAILFHRRVWF